MSTLDELKKQAAEATQRNQVATPAPGGATEEQQWRKLAPVMKYLQDHFTELANTLNVLEKVILVDFEINDSVTLKSLKAQNYKITHPTADKEKDFVFELEPVGFLRGYFLCYYLCDLQPFYDQFDHDSKNVLQLNDEHIYSCLFYYRLRQHGDIFYL